MCLLIYRYTAYYYVNTYVFIMCDVNVFKRETQMQSQREKSSIEKHKAGQSRRSATLDRPFVRKFLSEDVTIEYKPE